MCRAFSSHFVNINYYLSDQIYLINCQYALMTVIHCSFYQKQLHIQQLGTLSEIKISISSLSEKLFVITIYNLTHDLIRNGS